ncbi:MAG: methyl-accepting chemotaxis protein [Acidobacteria bacterium]|nr:methyl-accepting chemotaxis protein [Acidobacteriota bacterium]
MSLSQLLQNLSIGQRTLASVGLFSLPLGVLFYFNLDQLSSNITFANQEIAGNRYQQPLVRLVKAMGDYQLSVFAAALTPARAGAVPAREQEVEGLLSALEKVEGEVGAELGFSTAALKEASQDSLRVASLRNKWQALKQQSRKPESSAWTQAGDALVADLRSMISRAGDMSNLTLDPEMDSYYLADVTSVAAAQSLGRLRAASLLVMPQLLAKGQVTPGDRTQVAIVAAAIKESDYDRITGDLDTAFRENAKAKRGASLTLKREVQPVKTRYEQALPALVAALNDVAAGKGVRAEDLARTFEEASLVTVDLAGKTVSELDAVLRARIDGYASYRWTLIAGTLAALGVAGLLFVLVVRSITKPLALAMDYLEHVTQGDLSRELPAELRERGDEIGQLSRSMQLMLTNLRSMMAEIGTGIRALATASQDLMSASSMVTSGSRDAYDKAQLVAAAAEQMSSNVTSVASGMGQAASSLGQVSSATDQMTATISEIATNSEQARVITADAARQAQQVTEQIQRLGQAAREIGKVTEAITEISSQTNLLALNATIEAARAGSAGKGFAVVANEIKTLAQQTAAATEDIRQRIASVQSATSQGIADVERVSSVIDGINAIVSSIAAAIEEQALVTKDIARNINQASAGVQNANVRVAESSEASHEIAQDIEVVNRAAGEMASSGESLRSNVSILASVSEQLERVSGRFHV